MTAAVSKVRAAAIASDWLKTPPAALNNVPAHPAPLLPELGTGRAWEEEGEHQCSGQTSLPAPPREGATKDSDQVLCGFYFILFYFCFILFEVLGSWGGGMRKDLRPNQHLGLSEFTY